MSVWFAQLLLQSFHPRGHLTRAEDGSAGQRPHSSHFSRHIAELRLAATSLDRTSIFPSSKHMASGDIIHSWMSVWGLHIHGQYKFD